MKKSCAHVKRHDVKTWLTSQCSNFLIWFQKGIYWEISWGRGELWSCSSSKRLRNRESWSENGIANHRKSSCSKYTRSALFGCVLSAWKTKQTGCHLLCSFTKSDDLPVRISKKTPPCLICLYSDCLFLLGISDWSHYGNMAFHHFYCYQTLGILFNRRD